MPDERSRHRRDRWNPWEPARETLIDRKIREAMAEGGWDDLPYQGQRLPIEDDSAAGDWAMAYRMLKSARLAPPWIEADKEARQRLAERDALAQSARGAGSIGRRWRRSELERIVAAANDAIRQLNAEAPSERQHRRLLDLEQELAALDRAEQS